MVASRVAGISHRVAIASTTLVVIRAQPAVSDRRRRRLRSASEGRSWNHLPKRRFVIWRWRMISPAPKTPLPMSRVTAVSDRAMCTAARGLASASGGSTGSPRPEAMPVAISSRAEASGSTVSFLWLTRCCT